MSQDNNKNDTRSLSDPNTWVEQHGDYLYRCAVMRVRDAQVAQDIVQDTLLAALQARASFSGKSSERTWMVAILKHKVIDYFRRASRDQPLENLDRMIVDAGDEENQFNANGHWAGAVAGQGDWANDPRTMVENKQFWEILRVCLEGLPERTAKVFYLREIDGIESDEVCKALNVTPSNLWVLLHRARSRLRACFEARWSEVHPAKPA